MQLDIKIDLPETGAGYRLGMAVLDAHNRNFEGPGLPSIMLTFTDPELQELWKDKSQVDVTATVIRPPSDRPVDAVLADQVLSLLFWRGRSAHLALADMHALSVLLDLGSNGQLRQAFRVIRKQGNYKLKSPDTKLMGINNTETNAVNLTKLHNLVAEPYFDWSFSRYYRATPARLNTIRTLDAKLTKLGIFDLMEKK